MMIPTDSCRNKGPHESGGFWFCIFHKTFGVTQIVFLGLFGFIVFLAVKASRRYKMEKVDAEKEKLIAEIERLTEINKKITKRNMELGEELGQTYQGARPQ